MLGGIGAQELILIFLAVLLLFGAKKVPEVAKGLGKGIQEFRKAMREASNELTKEEHTNTKNMENKKQIDKPEENSDKKT